MRGDSRRKGLPTDRDVGERPDVDDRIEQAWEGPLQRLTVMLRPEAIEAIAKRVVDLLREETSAPTDLLTAEALARRLGVARSWVYAHANELGGRRLGDGLKPRLRFDVVEAEKSVIACSRSKRPPEAVQPLPERKTANRTKASMGTNDRLLPIRGQKERNYAPRSRATE
jgi:hypothetical protein